jgi:hypothetical protein
MQTIARDERVPPCAMRKINSRTSSGVGLLPNCLRTLEIRRQYIQKPVRCQRTMVSGVTMMKDCFQSDQTRRATTEKSLSKRPRLGRRCRRVSGTRTQGTGMRRGYRYVTPNVTTGTNPAATKSQAVEIYGRPVRTRTADLYRVNSKIRIGWRGREWQATFVPLVSC